MSAHTPRPWKFVAREVLEDGSVYPGHIIGGVTEMQICLLESSAVAELKQNDPVWSRMPAGPFEEPNANLIAASPDSHEANKAALMVLCALEKANDWHPNMSKDIEFAIEACRAAIAKATGAKP